MAVASRRTGKYGDAKGFPKSFEMVNVGDFIAYLEENDFKWRPLVKTMDEDHLTSSFGEHLCYADGRIIGYYKNKSVPAWFAFGDGNRVYKIRITYFDGDTGLFEYEYDLQQRNKLTLGFQNYLQFRDSAIRYFGLK